MSTLLEQAWQKVSKLPPEDQEAVAARILKTLGEEEAWQKFVEARREDFEKMAEEALDEHKRGLTHPLDKLID